MKNLKVSQRLSLGFGIVLILVFAMGIFWQRGIAKQAKISHEGNEMLGLKEQLRAMQMAHYKWVDDLRNTVRDKSEFKGQLDHTKCAFGKWYYSYDCERAEIKEAFAALAEPHHKLHQAGKVVVGELAAGRYGQADAISLHARQELLPSLMLVYDPFMGKIGEVCDALSHQELKSAADQKKMSFVVMGTALVLVVFLAFFITRSITKPVLKVVTMIKDIAEGEGDLTKRVQIDSGDEIGELARWFNTFVEKLHDIIYQVAGATMQIASSAQELASTAEEMAAGSEEQTTQTSQVATSMEEMSATVQQVAKNSSTAAGKARGAGETASKGGEVVSQTVQGMGKIAAKVKEMQGVIEGLNSNSEKIGDIVSVIDDVADQTNLLALNAAIEAARAGEQGRGFAVVADEVRKLAERTTASTKEIAAMVKSIQGDTSRAVGSMETSAKEVESGVSLANQAGESLKEILNAAKTVQDMVQQIATAAEQQSAAAEEISSNVESIASVSKQSAAASQQTSLASQEISRLTDDLQAIVLRFKLNKQVEAAKAKSAPVQKMEVVNPCDRESPGSPKTGGRHSVRAS